jgi:diguanylate cyclase (GGDEF)-like protein
VWTLTALGTIAIGVGWNWPEISASWWPSALFCLCVTLSCLFVVHLSSVDTLFILGIEAPLLAMAPSSISPACALSLWLLGMLVGYSAAFLNLPAAAEASLQNGAAGAAMILVAPTPPVASLSRIPAGALVAGILVFFLVRVLLSLLRAVTSAPIGWRRTIHGLSRLRLLYLLTLQCATGVTAVLVARLLDRRLPVADALSGDLIVITIVALLTLAFVEHYRSNRLRRRLALFLDLTQQLPRVSPRDLRARLLSYARRGLPSFHVGWEMGPVPRHPGGDWLQSPPIVGDGATYRLRAERSSWRRPFIHPDQELLDTLAAVANQTLRARGEATSLRQLADSDRLTGLLNYGAFKESLLRLSQQPQQSGLIALIYIDIDNFKSINDSFGHETGNAVLRTVAARLRAAVRSDDLVARVGGDEFAAVLTGVASRSDARRIAERIATETGKPITADGLNVVVHLSQGLTFAENGQQDFLALIESADQLMYATRGRAITAAARPAAPKAITAGTPFVDAAEAIEIRQAILEERLSLALQPIVDLGTGRVVSVEALVRYRDPQLGDLPVAHILREAQGAGLLNRLALQMLSKGLAATARLQRAVPNLRVLHVNIDLNQLLDHEFLAPYETIRQHYPGIRVVLEINELSLRATGGEMRTAVEKSLRRHHLTVALDDLGKAYSSLYALTAYPLYSVKVDKLLLDVFELPRTADVLGMVVDLAHRLGTHLVFEGVETSAQKRFLRTLGARYAQGFLFAGPMPVDDLARLLAAHGGRLPARR